MPAPSKRRGSRLEQASVSSRQSFLHRILTADMHISWLKGKEQRLLAENISLLLASGMDVSSALSVLSHETRSRSLQRTLLKMQTEVEAGVSLWRVFAETKLFPERDIRIIRIGEEHGQLVGNLRIVGELQKRNHEFLGKIVSATIYPAFIMVLALVIGVGVAWFILPRLANVFLQLDIHLPVITRILLQFGVFLQHDGAWVVPLVLMGLLLFFTIIFTISRTRRIVQSLLLYFPGVGRLLREVELSRLGYIMSALLTAGVPIDEALKATADASGLWEYQRALRGVYERIIIGDSLHAAFQQSKTKLLIPSSVQYLLAAGEEGGSLPEAFFSVAKMYEGKMEGTMKNLSVIFEPVLLVGVWFGVLAVALSIILPIYSLVGDFSGSVNAAPTPEVRDVTTP